MNCCKRLKYLQIQDFSETVVAGDNIGNYLSGETETIWKIASKKPENILLSGAWNTRQ